jgi:TPR repeat protein
VSIVGTWRNAQSGFKVSDIPGADVKQRVRAVFVGGVLALALVGSATAGPLEEGLIAYQNGDYAEVLRLWRPLANQGNAIAQAQLGIMYLNGQVVPQDYGQAVAWLRKAAAQGNADAQSGLGVMYTFGRGVPQDNTRAVAWLRKAAEQGNAEGEGRLGEMYVNGQGVPQDYVQAHMWLRKGAEQGNNLAQNSLGFLYETGRGVPQDFVQAHMWYNLAASNAQDTLGSETSSQMRDLVAAKMTPAQIAEAQKMAREWGPK